jgi:ribosomal protein S18 acetylase RimI-like enzyme
MRYELREELPTVQQFQALRDAAGMSERSREGVERGLPNSVYGVTVVEVSSGDVVGMARIVGDGGSVYHICNMAVHPDHQRRGLGSRMMDAIMAYIEETRPASKGMFYRATQAARQTRGRQGSVSTASWLMTYSTPNSASAPPATTSTPV